MRKSVGVRKGILLFCVFLLMLCFCGKMHVRAAEKWQTRDWSECGETRYYYNQLSEREKELYDELDGVCNRFLTSTEDAVIENYLNCSYIADELDGNGLTSDEVSKVATYFKWENPQYYFLKSVDRSQIVDSITGTTYIVSIQVYDEFASGTQRAGYTAQLSDELDEYLNAVAGVSRDYDKVKVIHDLMCNKIEYSTSMDNGWDQQCVSAMTGDRRTVCSGYAHTFTLLCNAAGLECIRIEGTASQSGMSHAWNKVLIDNVWYNVDVTWDDPDGGYPPVRYDYFCISDNTLYQNHTAYKSLVGVIPVSNYDYVGNGWVKGTDGELRLLDSNGNTVKNQFAFDGAYTYYLQADGTPMKDRLTYHPDGEHIIYFDEYGHEVFNAFQYCPSVGYICYFDSQGYLYKDMITFVGDKTYYLNGNGEMEQNGWFQYMNGRDFGYANADGTLMDDGWGYDPYGRVVFYHWNGMVARGLISDGKYYYSMDQTDGHYLGSFPVY